MGNCCCDSSDRYDPIYSGQPRVFDQQGFDQQGWNKQGYDREGYDKQGYNQHGYNRKGLNRLGYDRKGRDVMLLKWLAKSEKHRNRRNTKSNR